MSPSGQSPLVLSLASLLRNCGMFQCNLLCLSLYPECGQRPEELRGAKRSCLINIGAVASRQVAERNQDKGCPFARE